jgi:hypothetical protein
MILEDGLAVWHFRWSETGAQEQRVYRKRVVGIVESLKNSPTPKRLLFRAVAGVLD